MAKNSQDIKKLLSKVDAVTREKKLDLSADEDLSIAIMNLISIEEHLFFTSQKTGKSDYLDLLDEVRQMRKELLQKIIHDYEGEVWCISKHLLASSMRLMEVGTKELGKGNKKEAENLFDKAYKLYSLFWGINLDIIKTDKINREDNEVTLLSENGKEKSKSSVFDKLGILVQKAVDCCKE
ncbi:MAG: hypothetical protein C4584_01930 [Armatimonadetes bacterium]|nr:MAG: hypothetical protein C4584_01930 [Armatimonadota bacterium]